MNSPSDMFFTSSATVKRSVVVADAIGAPRKPNYQPVVGLVGIPCSVQSSTAHVRYVWGQRQIEMDHEVYFQDVLALNRGDRLDIDDGRQLTLVGWSDEALQGRVFIVVCKLVVP